MRSTPHHDPADALNAAADTAETVAGQATNAADAVTQKLGDTADTAAQKLDDAVAQGKDAVTQGREWLQSIDIDEILEQIPQPLRDLGAQAVDRVRRLSPTQQIVGGALLAFSVGLLATRSSRKDRKADAKAGKKYRAKYD